MCPIHKVGKLSALVDESVFLKEVHVAARDAGKVLMPPRAAVGEAAQWCLDQLSESVRTDWRLKVPGAACNLPRTGALAPVDLDEISADPACTVKHFAGVLRGWGIEAVPAVVAQGIREAVRRLDLNPGDLHRLHHQVPALDGPAVDWSVHYVPFSLLQDKVGLLFAFTAAQVRPHTHR